MSDSPRSNAAFRAPAAARWLDSFALGAACLVGYLALRQQAVHGMDAYYLVSFAAQGIDHSYHLLYLRIVAALRAALEPLGLGLYDVMLVASGLGTAVAVSCLHRAALALGLGRGPAAGVAALCAVSPAVVFFATVVEIHGVFFAFAGLAWLVLARLRRALSLRWAAALGAATGLSSCVHATGHLLLGLVVLVLWSLVLPERALRPARAAGLALAAAAAHAVVAAGFAWALKPGALGNQTDFLLSYASRERTAWQLPWTLWSEWLWPFFPVSALCALAALTARHRPVLMATAAALAVYLGVTWFMLAGDTERGAYLLPLAFPAALLVVRVTPRPVWAGAIVLAGVLAVRGVIDHDRPESGDEAWVQGVAALAERTKPFLLCAGEDEVNPILRRAAEIPCVGLYHFVGLASKPEDHYQRFCAEFDATFDSIHRSGLTLFVTRAAYAALSQTDHPVLGPFFTRHLPSRYTLTPEQEGGFAAYRMERIPDAAK